MRTKIQPQEGYLTATPNKINQSQGRSSRGHAAPSIPARRTLELFIAGHATVPVLAPTTVELLWEGHATPLDPALLIKESSCRIHVKE